MQSESHLRDLSGYPRKPWLAALLGLVLGPFGLLYTSTLLASGVFALCIAFIGLFINSPGVWPSLILSVTCMFIGLLYSKKPMKLSGSVLVRNLDRPGRLKTIVIISLWLLLSFFISHFIRGFVGLNSRSMVPTIRNQEKVLTVIFPYLWGPIRHGTVVRYRNPTSRGELISRVVALQGDRVEMKKGLVYVNGKATDDSLRISKLNSAGCIDKASAMNNIAILGVNNQIEAISLTISTGQVYVLADNRGDSFLDSRFFGPLALSKITGVVYPSSSSAKATLEHKDCINPPFSSLFP